MARENSGEGGEPDWRMAVRTEAGREAARRSLEDFCRLDERYVSTAHGRALIGALEAVERREIRRLVVALPPQTGKTYLVSQRFPAWCIGRDPTQRVILASYAAELALTNSAAVRRIVEDERLWPFFSPMDPEGRAADRWRLLGQDQTMRAAGRGGGITGFAGDVVVVDDLLRDREEADSKVIRDAAWQWFTDVAQTRLSARGVVVVMSTRWHEDDVTGRLLNSADAASWTTLSIPAVAERGDPLGRPVGEALQPPGYGSPEEYAWRLPKVALGQITGRAWAALYQQRPSPEEGGVLKRAWIKRWTVLPPDRVDEKGRAIPGSWAVIQSVDTAAKTGVANDFSVIATWGTDGKHFYLVDCWRGRVEYPDLKREVQERWKRARFRPRAVLIEDSSAGQALIQDLQQSSGVPVVAKRITSRKSARVDGISALFEGGLVEIPEHAPWVEEWIEEHVGFPGMAHDDQVDSTTLALAYLRGAAFRVERVEVRMTTEAIAYPKGSFRARFLTKTVQHRAAPKG